MAKARARAASVEIVRTGLGRSRHGRPRVRIIKMTQSLRGDGFDEPAGSEHFGTCSEPKKECAEGGQVENRRQRPHHPGEPHDILHPPALWLGDVGRADIVEGYADLRDVIEQIVQQDLGSQHRQERQEERRRRH